MLAVLVRHTLRQLNSSSSVLLCTLSISIIPSTSTVHLSNHTITSITSITRTTHSHRYPTHHRQASSPAAVIIETTPTPVPLPYLPLPHLSLALHRLQLPLSRGLPLLCIQRRVRARISIIVATLLHSIHRAQCRSKTSFQGCSLGMIACSNSPICIVVMVGVCRLR